MTLQEAIDKLKEDLGKSDPDSTIKTVQDLQDFAKSVSVDSTSPNGVLYSGDVTGPDGATTPAYKMAKSVANSMDWGILDDTDRAKLFNTQEFRDAFDRVTKGLSQPEKDALMGKSSGDSFWAQASRDFADSLTGDVFTMTPDADISKVFGTDELRTVLNNPKVDSVTAYLATNCSISSTPIRKRRLIVSTRLHLTSSGTTG